MNRILLAVVSMLLSACGPALATSSSSLGEATCYAFSSVRMALSGPAVVVVQTGQTPEGAVWAGQFSWVAWAAGGDDPDVHQHSGDPVQVPCP